MLKVDKIKELHLHHRKLKNKFEVSCLSSLLGEIDRKMKGRDKNVTNLPIKSVESGVLASYYDNLIRNGSKEAKKELDFLRREKIIENRMNSQEIDLQLLALNAKLSKENEAFSKNPKRHNIVLQKFVEQFVPTVADFDVVKIRHKKIFHL